MANENHYTEKHQLDLKSLRIEYFLAHDIKGWGPFDAMLFPLRESRKTPDPALPRVRSSVTTASPSVALALKPSDFCNNKVHNMVA